ncbi:hypothetical protein M3J09_000989 [Ascochyta lentis]
MLMVRMARRSGKRWTKARVWLAMLARLGGQQTAAARATRVGKDDAAAGHCGAGPESMRLQTPPNGLHAD